MKLNAKMLLPALGLPLLLAACGSASTGSGTVKFNDLKTEYRDAAGSYVACDNDQPRHRHHTEPTSAFTTRHPARSAASISACSATPARLRQQLQRPPCQGSQLQKPSAATTTRRSSIADSTTGLLPQAIVVKPNPDVAIKTVTTSGSVGSFYAKLTINSGSAERQHQQQVGRCFPRSRCTATAP